MDDEWNRAFGTSLVYLGIILLFVFLLSPGYWNIQYYTWTPPYRYDLHILPYLLLLAISVIVGGIFVRRKFPPRKLYVTSTGKQIHVARIWERTHEEELYLTSCELVVSTNQTSNRTAHVGYHLISAERPTCNKCSTKEGNRVLEVMRVYREG
ncbi:MAG: hypothetical protein ACFFEJ_07015 [Candidatus Thorarchaeota archaeon]